MEGENSISKFGKSWTKSSPARFCHGRSLCSCPEGLTEDSVTLLRGGNHCEGLVSVQRGGQRGKVCGDHWGLEEAAVICRQLGCGRGLFTPRYVLWPTERERPLLRFARCQGDEASLWNCSLGPWVPVQGCACNCFSGVHCSGRRPGQSPPTPHPREAAWGEPLGPSPHCDGPMSCSSRSEAGTAQARNTFPFRSAGRTPGQPFLGSSVGPNGDHTTFWTPWPIAQASQAGGWPGPSALVGKGRPHPGASKPQELESLELIPAVQWA